MAGLKKAKKAKPVKLEGSLRSLLVSGLAGSKIEVVDYEATRIEGWANSSSEMLNYIGGGGLVPFRKFVEVYGNAALGKSLIGYDAIRNTQARGGIGVILDVERAFDATRQGNQGLDPDNLIIVYPDTVEDVFKSVEKIISVMVKEGDGREVCILWDSVAAATSLSEAKKDYGEIGYLDHARIISQGFRKLVKHLSKINITFIMLNQAKKNISPDAKFVGDVATFGGTAPGFWSWLRWELRLVRPVKDAKKRVRGYLVKFSATKNRTGKPFTPGMFFLDLDFGLSKPFDLLMQGMACGIVKQKGGFRRFELLGQGKGIDLTRLLVAAEDPACKWVKALKSGVAKAKEKGTFDWDTAINEITTWGKATKKPGEKPGEEDE